MVTGIAFCLYVKSFKNNFFQFAGMLKSGAVVLNFEGFRSKKSGIMIKELDSHGRQEKTLIIICNRFFESSSISLF